MITGIYKITNLISNKSYVGSSVDIICRWYQHKTTLKNNKHHSIKLQRAYNKYGVENFKYEIIEECEVTVLFIQEQYYIDFFNCYDDGYNILPVAGSNLGMKHSDETKEILRQKSKGNKNNLGRIVSNETREKIREKLKGIPLSDETKLKMSKSQKGRIMSDETKLKLSKSKKGIPLSNENKEKLRLCHLGKKQSKEVIENRAKKNTGKKRTDEIKLKMSISMKGIKKGPMSEEQKMLRSRKIALISENGDIISEYYSIKKCAEELGVSHQRISEVLSGKRVSFKNMYFKYI